MALLKEEQSKIACSWAPEYLHLCHHSKKKIIELKLDFEKAFDKMEHSSVLKVLHATPRFW